MNFNRSASGLEERSLRSLEDRQAFGLTRGPGFALKVKSPEPGGEEPRPQPRLRAVNRCQMVLRPTDVEQLIEAHHPARAIWEIVGQQNLDGFFGAIEAVEGVIPFGCGSAALS